ncbi:MAG: hypothetical protein ACRDVK_09075 [Acidimicrobiia bacterium]
MSPAPRDLSQVDLATIDAAVICATAPTRPLQVDLAQVEYLAAHSGAHLVYPSIVGCDLMPWPYYQAKVACERSLQIQADRWTIIRATQFHQLIWGWYSAPTRWPWLAVPAETRYQVLDPTVLADALAAAVSEGAVGRLADIGGPFAYEAGELARSCLRAIGRRRPVVTYNKRGLFGAALRAGANLTPNRAGGETWNEFVARQLQT